MDLTVWAGDVTDRPVRLDGTAWDMPERDYFADPWLAVTGERSASSSVLKALLPPSTPAHAQHAVATAKHSAAFNFGHAVHEVALGRGAGIVIVEASSWQTKVAQAARDAAYAAGRTPMLPEQYAAARTAALRLRANPDAARVLAQPHRPEVVLTWREPDPERPDEPGTPCRAMADIWPVPRPGVVPILGDVKTIEQADDATITANVESYAYGVQRWHYVLGYWRVHGVMPAYLLLFVEKTPPHEVAVVELDADAVEHGALAHERALAVWRECIRTNTWPGRPPGVRTIGRPRWARGRTWED